LKAELDEAREASLLLLARSCSLEEELNEARAKHLDLLKEKVQWVVEKNALKAACKERDEACAERDRAWAAEEKSSEERCAALAESACCRTERDQARLQRDEAYRLLQTQRDQAGKEFENLRTAYLLLKDEAGAQALAAESSRKALSEQVESLTKKFSLHAQRQQSAIEQMYETAYRAAIEAIRKSGGYFGPADALDLTITIEGLGDL
jgi:hypothetical protein